MLLSWSEDDERIRTAPFPEAWLRVLERTVPYYAHLSTTEQEVLQGDLRIFIKRKYWEGCGGLELTGEMQVTIAAQACLLTLCLPDNLYPNVRSIFVYPAAYRAKALTVGPGGVVTEGMSDRLGEAWQTGPVVLSWQDAQAGGANPSDGRNVVFHEFAHKLDILDGAVDGFPRLYSDEEYERWHTVMNEEWDALVEGDRATILDSYGATNAGELFAVATEAFFEKPIQMRKRHPALYLAMKEYFRQDPAGRLDAPELPDE